MKKLISLVICLVMVTGALCMTGCGDKKAAYVGKWESEVCKHDAKEAKTSDLWGEFTLNLKEDGSAKVTLAGIDSKGKWSLNDDGTSATLVTKDFTDIKLPLGDEKLTMDFGEDTIIFKKCEEE